MMYAELEGEESSGDNYSDNSASGSDEPLWYNFIVNDDVGSWGLFMTYEEDFSQFILYTAAEDICVFTPDWKTGNPEDGAWGFFVSDDLGMCPYVEENGYTYSSYTYDEATLLPISMTGPWGYQW